MLDENFFIEQALRATTLNGLSDDDLAAYRAPYPTRESRRPLLEWPRAWPIDGEPADVTRRVESYDHWLAATDEIPKLLLTFDGPPDVLLIGPETVDWCARNIASLEIENCGDAGHLAPEDQSESIAAAITEWANRQYLFSRRHR